MNSKQLIEEVKVNMDKLNHCEAPHDFSIDMDKGKPINKRFQCTKCGGYIWEIDKIWYERGLLDSLKIK